MSRDGELWLWVTMRVSALMLAFAVVVHLATIIYAVRGGLSAAEILARTQGNVAWLVFYVTFAVAASVHAAIGLRTIVREHTRWQGRGLDLATLLMIVGLTAAGTGVMRGLF